MLSGRIDNSIFIIGGSEEPMIEATIQDYKFCNSQIQSCIIPKTKHLPQCRNAGCRDDGCDAYVFFSKKDNEICHYRGAAFSS